VLPTSSTADASVTRRQLLLALASLTPAGLVGCSSHSQKAGPTGVNTSPVLISPSTALNTNEEQLTLARRYEALRDLLSVVRTSPDNLRERADAAVGAKDVGRIVELVSSLAVAPTSDALRGTKWGPNATLRSGSGTLRDRADLMALLLQRVGLDAEVVTAPAPVNFEWSSLLDGKRPEFLPDQAALTSLFRKYNVALPSDLETSSADVEPAADFSDAVQAILTALPDSLQVAKPLPLPPKPPFVPAVDFTMNGIRKRAYGLGSGAFFDVPKNEPALPAVAGPSFNVTLSVVFHNPQGQAQPSKREIDVASGSWPISVVAGGLLTVAFPPIDGPALLGGTVDDRPIRVPTWRLQPAEGQERNKPATAQGFPLHADGWLVQTSATDTTSHGPLGALRILHQNDLLKARQNVSTLSFTARQHNFPSIDIDITAKDDLGGPIVGLRAGDFEILENDSPVTVSLMANTPQPTRVLVLVDVSGSIDNFWKDKRADRDEFERQVAQGILMATSGEATVEIMEVGRVWPDHVVKTRAVEGEIMAALRKGRSGIGWTGTSEVWKTLIGALASRPTAIVVISDFDSQEELGVRDIGIAAIRDAGIGVVCVPVAKANQEVLSQLVATDQAIVVKHALDELGVAVREGLDPFVELDRNVSYRLRYTSRLVSDQPRSTTVRLRERTEIASRQESTPLVETVRQKRSGIAGIFATVNGERVHLAGVRFSDREPTHDDLEECRALLGGVTTISIEAGQPLAGAMFDDLISALVTLEPLEEVWDDGVEAHLKKLPSIRRIPALFAQLLREHSEAATTSVHPETLQISVLQEYVLGDRFVQRIDIPPALNQFRSYTSDRSSAFRETLRTSLVRSWRESQVSDVSAFAMLNGIKLKLIPASTQPFAAFAEFDEATKTRWIQAWGGIGSPFPPSSHYLIPEDGSVDALWSIDAKTGTAVARFLNGAGGALTNSCADIAVVQFAASYALTVATVVCSVNQGLNCWAVTTMAALWTVACAVAALPGDAFDKLSAAAGVASFVISWPRPTSADGAVRTALAFFLTKTYFLLQLVHCG
jgi:hypothetical protein